jgi:hypothetical protein
VARRDKWRAPKVTEVTGLIARLIPRMLISALERGSSSAVERQLPKLDVTGSIPVSRSIISKNIANLAVVLFNTFSDFTGYGSLTMSIHSQSVRTSRQSTNEIE